MIVLVIFVERNRKNLLPIESLDYPELQKK